MRIILQIITIVSSIGLVFIIVNTELTNYLIWIVGAVILLMTLYILFKKYVLKHHELLSGSNLEVFFIIIGILLAIFLTDGFNSLIFFLVYLLLFGISILFSPYMVFITLAGMLALFIQQYSEQNLLTYWLPIVMLLTVTPISFFFGKEFHRRENRDELIRNSAQKIHDQARTLKVELEDSSPELTQKVETLVKESSRLEKTAKHA